MAENTPYQELLKKAKYLHDLLAENQEKLTDEHITADTKIVNDFISKVERQIAGRELAEIKIYSLRVKAIDSTRREGNYYTYIDPHSGKMSYDSLRYFPAHNPGFNYTTAWVSYSQEDGVILRPYTMPGSTPSDCGASIDHLIQSAEDEKKFDISFQKVVNQAKIIHFTDMENGYYGLYITHDDRRIYLVPNSSKYIIEGTMDEDGQDIYVWKYSPLPTQCAYPVPSTKDE